MNDKISGISGLKGDNAYPDDQNLLPPLPMGKSGELMAKNGQPGMALVAIIQWDTLQKLYE